MPELPECGDLCLVEPSVAFVWRGFGCTPFRRCVQPCKCYWIVYCHKSQSLSMTRCDRRPPTHPFIQLLRPERCVGPLGSEERNVGLRERGILNAPPVYWSRLPQRGSRDSGRGLAAEWKGNLVASVLRPSDPSLTLPRGQAWRTPLVLPVSRAASPRSRPPSPWARLHFTQPYWFFFWRKCGWVVRANEGGRGNGESEGVCFIKHWLLLDTSRRDTPVRTTQWARSNAENC